MHFYWQLLIILFADDRAKKNMQLQLLVFQERKNIFLTRQRGVVMAFIPDLVDILFSNMAECVARL